MPRFTYNGVTLEVSDETAANLSSDYKPVEEKKAEQPKTTRKRASSKTEK